MKSTHALRAALIAMIGVAGCAHAGESAQQPYPAKPIRLIVPFTPGGAPDIVGRLLAARLYERLGKQVIVDNRSGAGGIIGTETVARAEPDGYTLLFTSVPHILQPALQRVSFDPVTSFTPIAKVGTVANSLVVYPGFPANSTKELIAIARQKPGGVIFGGSGIGTSGHLAVELFRIMAGIDVLIVQYRGGGPSALALLGGHSNALIGTLVQNLPFIRAGTMRILGTGGPKRSVILPDVPAITETVPGYESTQWWGMLGPARMPPAIVNRLTGELKAIVASEEITKRFLNEGAEADYLVPAEFGVFLQREKERWTNVVKKADVRMD
jgi:tripartite-type tricarboxylate transporter receptor subunit TctC